MGSEIVLHIGDIVYDPKIGDVGVLLVLANDSASGMRRPYEDVFELWVWEIFWINEGITRYTEGGIINMIKDGYLLLYANN